MLTQSLFCRPNIEKTPRIKWRAISVASSYRIEIIQSGSQIINTKTRVNYYDAPLTHGVYYYRITAYDNKNEELARSGWEPLVIQSWSLISQQYYYIGIGAGFEYITPYWNDIIGNSNSWNIYAGYDLAYPGIELEAIFDMQSYPHIPKHDKVETSLRFYSLHTGIFYFARLSDYFTAGVRITPGLTYTTMKIKDIEDTWNETSFSLSMILGLGLRLNISYGFIEHGVEYKHILLNGEDFRLFRPYLRGGTRF
ncbi:MAG: outer membrane beta-barrel protein [Spirochaetes bacterium]|nr:outer membrane beta-barrel protein [Spirochaetota bacterium]